MTRKVFVVCNALDDATRQARRISTDSPGCFAKGLPPRQDSAARRRAGRCAQLRTRSPGPIRRLFRAGRPARRRHTDRLCRSCSVRWCPNSFRCLHYSRRCAGFVALLAPPCALLQPAGHSCAGLAAGEIAGSAHSRRSQDGEVGYARWSVAGVVSRLCRWTFDRNCSGGALLACSALADLADLEPTMCYYGTIEVSRRMADWQAPSSPSCSAARSAPVREDDSCWTPLVRCAVQDPNGAGDCASL